MLNKLKQKWGVDTLQVLLIICTFALGGSLCGWIGRKILSLMAVEKGFKYYIFYILLMTLFWPLSVLTASLLTGQFRFFKQYITKIFRKLSGRK